jgi:hypothetical protein
LKNAAGADTDVDSTTSIQVESVFNGTSWVAVTTSSPAVVLPAGGTVKLSPDGSFTYTPPKNYIGLDSFKYRVGNGTFALPPGVHMNLGLTLTEGTVTIDVKR